ncbi:phospholipase D family protein [Luteitalea sp. TBR-22]|nr:phospholipase D family protein [Luteitalea sp. TBR-22]
MRALALLALSASVTACASLPTVRTIEPSFVIEDTEDTAVARSAARSLGALAGPSGIHLLPRGPGAFLARLVLAEAAQRSIDAQYYIWEDDTVGKALMGALVRAADRGVRVRLLIDDIGSLPDDQTLLVIDAHPNIDVRLFNPASTRSARGMWMVTDFARVNRRMHNKSFTVDNRMTIVGGRNIGDAYFEAASSLNYGDMDAIAIGAAVPEVSSRFDRYWNSPVVYGIGELHRHRAGPADAARLRASLDAFLAAHRDNAYAQDVRDSPLAQELRQGAVSFTSADIRVMADDIAKVERPGEAPEANLLPQLLPEITRAREALVLVSPYFVPGKGGVRTLAELRARGVAVKVLTNGIASTDELPVFAKYRKYRRALLEAGVELYEVNPQGPHDPGAVLQTTGRPAAPGGRPPSVALHGKLLVFDCREFFVGSMNLDPRSASINTEVGFVVDAPPVATTLCSGLDESLTRGAYRLVLEDGDTGSSRLEWIGLDEGKEHRLTREPHSSRWLRVKAWFFGLLPIERQL